MPANLDLTGDKFRLDADVQIFDNHNELTASIEIFGQKQKFAKRFGTALNRTQDNQERMKQQRVAAVAMKKESLVKDRLSICSTVLKASAKRARTNQSEPSTAGGSKAIAGPPKEPDDE